LTRITAFACAQWRRSQRGARFVDQKAYPGIALTVAGAGEAQSGETLARQPNLRLELAPPALKGIVCLWTLEHRGAAQPRPVRPSATQKTEFCGCSWASSRLLIMQGESMRVVRFDRRRPNLRLELTPPSK